MQRRFSHALMLAATMSLLVLPAAPPAQARPPRASAAALAAARAFLCPHGGAPRRGGRCMPGSGTGLAAAADVHNWDAGIAAPTRQQLACPEGSVAMPALAQPSVTRCVPR